jgi:hypothetical protein
MSGGFSVPFSIVGAFTDGWARAICVALGTTCLVIAAYFVWKVERERADEATEKLRLKLKCSFRMDDPGCYRPDATITFESAAIPLRTFDGTSLTPDIFAARYNQHYGATTTHQIKCDYYRVKIEADCVGFVPQCSALITSIKKNGHVVMAGENLQLTIAPAERAAPNIKDVFDKTAEYADLLAITETVSFSLPQRIFSIPVR